MLLESTSLDGIRRWLKEAHRSTSNSTELKGFIFPIDN
jgi:hypothetical protein